MNEFEGKGKMMATLRGLLAGLMLGLAVVLLAPQTGHSAQLLPNGMQTFLDQNGQPLAGGQVFFYIPNTTSFKDTWMDPGQSQKNQNPVPLDMSGRAIIYGSGQYRQIVQDVYGNVIWDQLTGELSTQLNSYAGRSTGSASNYQLTALGFNYQDGQSITFIAAATNPGGASATANSGLSVPIYRDTAGGALPLQGGEIQQGASITIIYDKTAGIFHLTAFPNNNYYPRQTILAQATTDIGSTRSVNVNISSVANITSLGASSNLSLPYYFITFDANSTLVNSAALALPGSSNIVTQPNDFAIGLYLGSGNWRIVSYNRADGSSVTNPVFKPSGPNHAAGIVPDPGSTAGNHKYLREDATWQPVVKAIGEVTPPGTINWGNNVSSIVRNSLGNYTVAFGTPLPDSNYTVSLTAGEFINPPVQLSIFNKSAGGFTFIVVNTTNGSGTDIGNKVDFVVFDTH